MQRSVCLIRPPFFTPWSPPLGISLLKSFLEVRGHHVVCIDFNADSQLWSSHQKYFEILQAAGDGTVEGHSKLWLVLYAHALALVNGAEEGAIANALQSAASLYDLNFDRTIAENLGRVAGQILKRLHQLLAGCDFTRYDVVGTSTYSTSLGPSLFVLQHVKRVAPAVRTVMGGGVFFDDLALGSANLQTLLEEYPYVDHVVLGEGEMLFTQLLEGKINERVITLAALGNAALRMDEAPPPDFDDFDLDLYFHLTIEGGRSCPFQCSFCSETVQWGKYRKKTKETLAGQVIDLAAKHRNNRFFMADSLMNPYIEGFSKELIERDAAVLYDGYMRADSFVAANPERVFRWARSGCFRVRLGVETASASLLQTMDKKTTPDHISNALRALAQAGIRTTTYWIAGHPGETEADVEQTLQFIREHRDSIYELEIHPFYYAPYGQVASRLYKEISVYPEELAQITRFREWDILDCNPSRAERYRRARLVSQTAKDLGIPNIYSMTERFAAEARWQKLHPCAVEVY